LRGVGQADGERAEQDGVRFGEADNPAATEQRVEL
jgi:hypothetical protein